MGLGWRLGGRLGAFWGGLGAVLECLGAFWGRLGAFWGGLGAVLGLFWSVLGRVWVRWGVFGWFGVRLGCLGPVFEFLGAVLARLAH